MKTLLFLAITLSPFACDRSALNAEQRKRHFDELGPELRSMVKGARELSGGYEFQFPSDSATIQLVAEWSRIGSAPGQPRSKTPFLIPNIV
jgi:hypothetical protein